MSLERRDSGEPRELAPHDGRGIGSHSMLARPRRPTGHPITAHWCPGTCCCSLVSRFMPIMNELGNLPRHPLWENALQHIIESCPGVRLWRFLTVIAAVLA